MKQTRIGDVFDDLQELYTEKMVSWVPYYLDSVQNVIPDLAPSDQPYEVLDLGAGNGNIAAMVLQKYPTAKLALLDASAKMLDACKKRFAAFSKVTFLPALMEEVNLTSSKFDLITASYSLHHLENPAKKEVIRNIHRWLKPGGLFSYIDLFIDRKDAGYPALLEYWEAFVTKGAGQESWLELFDHHQKYDYPSNLPTNTEWLQDAGFSKIIHNIKGKYWVHILASR